VMMRSRRRWSGCSSLRQLADGLRFSPPCLRGRPFSFLSTVRVRHPPPFPRLTAGKRGSREVGFPFWTAGRSVPFPVQFRVWAGFLPLPLLSAYTGLP